jgi:1-acyl-sn-glycerol-3-phosphate acyltransferase
LVDRSNSDTRAKSVRALKAAIKNGISIFIFPEGTFNETAYPLKSFFDGAFRIAIETQTPIKPILLVDTLDRLHFHSIFSLTPGKNRVVFLKEVPVTDLTISDIPALKEKVYQMMDEGLRRYRRYSL